AASFPGSAGFSPAPAGSFPAAAASPLVPATPAWSAAASRQANRGPSVPASAPWPASSSARSRGSPSSPAAGDPGRPETLGAQAFQRSLAPDRPSPGSPVLEPAPAASSARLPAGLLHRSPP